MKQSSNNNLRKIRDKKKVSATELAYKAGVTERYIFFLEKGERNPSSDLSIRIAKILNCPVEEIFLPKNSTKSTFKSENVQGGENDL